MKVIKPVWEEGQCEYCFLEKEDCLCSKLNCRMCGEVITFRDGYQYCYGCDYTDDPHYWDW